VTPLVLLLVAVAMFNVSLFLWMRALQSSVVHMTDILENRLRHIDQRHEVLATEVRTTRPQPTRHESPTLEMPRARVVQFARRTARPA
jgi:hypothetical protein